MRLWSPVYSNLGVRGVGYRLHYCVEIGRGQHPAHGQAKEEQYEWFLARGGGCRKDNTKLFSAILFTLML